MSLAKPKRLQAMESTHKRAPWQEKALAKRLGGRTTAGSGNKTEKGDVRVFRFARVECKNTKDDGFRVTQHMVKKLENSGLTAEEIPFMQIDLAVGPDGKPGASFCVVPDYFLDIIEELGRRLRQDQQ